MVHEMDRCACSTLMTRSSTIAHAARSPAIADGTNPNVSITTIAATTTRAMTARVPNGAACLRICRCVDHEDVRIDGGVGVEIVPASLQEKRVTGRQLDALGAAVLTGALDCEYHQISTVGHHARKSLSPIISERGGMITSTTPSCLVIKGSADGASFPMS